MGKKKATDDDVDEFLSPRLHFITLSPSNDGKKYINNFADAVKEMDENVKRMQELEQ